jgi:hypothetical protein
MKQTEHPKKPKMEVKQKHQRKKIKKQKIKRRLKKLMKRTKLKLMSLKSYSCLVRNIQHLHKVMLLGRTMKAFWNKNQIQLWHLNGVLNMAV